MAHSFIYAKIDSNTERSVKIHEGLLQLFMYFFCEVSKQDIRPNSIESKIYDHYQIGVREYYGYREIMLEEISANPLLRSWYLPLLYKVELLLRDFGGYIDNEYLNSIPELLTDYQPNEIVYTQPVSVQPVIDLINAIRWVLNEDEIGPPECFRWFVTSNDVVILTNAVKK